MADSASSTCLPRGARVLVTGARGFLGRHLVRELVRGGAVVHATSRTPPPDGEGLEWHRCDPAERDDVAAVFAAAKPEYVFHLSSIADGRLDRALVLPILRSETVAAVNVLMAATESGTRRVVIPASLEEAAAGDAPSSPYAAAKTATHLYARMCHALYATPVVMARVFMAYGPGQPEWKLIPSVTARLLRGESPTIESPDRMVDWIHVADVIEGLLATMIAPDIEGRSVDLGSGALASVRGVVDRLRALTDPSIRPAYGSGPARGNERVQVADLAECARLTGWAPRIALDDGLRSVVAALRQAGGSGAHGIM
jgi:nucleoside-diphosphate-sugar epimerase